MTSLPLDFEGRLAARAALVATRLDAILSPVEIETEIHRPQRLLDAMRHGVLNGGKRLRPFLLAECAELFSPQGDLQMEARALEAGAALECIHCYSLIHDDLPAMDDDDLRRGQPTVHKAYGEAAAILAGDSLLTIAFDILSRPQTHPDAAVRIELVRLFSRASGLGGMAGGQMLDLDAEGLEQGEAQIMRLQAMKTGALLRCACEAGAVLGGADAAGRMAIVRFGELLGRAFQLADDILDATADAGALGKAADKDAGRGKATLVSLLGLDAARREARRLLEETTAALDPFGQRASHLRQAARFTVERGN
jgi:farnesyl diphosphate synthase